MFSNELSHRGVSIGRPAKILVHQLFADTRCGPEYEERWMIGMNGESGKSILSAQLDVIHRRDPNSYNSGQLSRE